MERLEQKHAALNNIWGSDIYHTFFDIKIHTKFQLGARYGVAQYK